MDQQNVRAAVPMALTERLRAARGRLRTQNAGTESQSAGDVPQRRPDGQIVASLAQEWWWLAERFVSSAFQFNVSEAIRIRGQLDPDLFARGLRRIIKRHDALRTCYRDIDGRPQPFYGPEPAAPLPVIEISGGSDERREQQAVQQAWRLASQPFNLASEIPLRAALFRLGEDDWLLTVVIHHIATDGWSMSIFWRDLAAVYQALHDGDDSDLPALGAQYTDFARWQRSYLAGDTLDRQLGYWRERLAGLPPLELPVDRRRPPMVSGRGEYYEFALPGELARRLRDFSNHSGVTLFTTLFAGFVGTLARWAGQTDFAVGTPVACRPQVEFESLIGFMANMVALRTDVGDDPSFGDFLRRVWDVAIGALEHQDIPFGKLVEELQPVRDPSRNPYFQVMFALNDDETASFDLPDATVAPIAIFNGSSEFDLSLIIIPRGDELTATVEFAADLFELTTIQRFSDHYQRLLADAAANPHKRLSELELLTPDQFAELTTARNGTQRAFESDRCVHEMFMEQARMRPAAIAVRDGARSVSYAELNTRSNSLARLLRSRGVGPETRVGVCLDRSAEMLVALLAVLKAGGAYIPIGPDYPPERSQGIISAGSVELLVTTGEIAERTSLDTDVPAVRLDTEAELIAGQPGTDLPSLVNPDNLAYVIFTSGSTGEPKGVMVPHLGLINLVAKTTQVPPHYTADDTVAAHITFTFDFSVTELLLPLACGATIALISDETAADANAFAAFLCDTNVTLMLATPTIWRLVLDGGWDGAPGFRALVGGDAVPPSLARELAGRVGRLWHAYGPTETTIFSTACLVPKSPGEVGGEPLSLGEPVANSQVYVLDGRLEPVPLGTVGEIFIGGVGVARGYAGRPDLTAERFMPDPFNPGKRLYRTGDLARMRAAGVLEFAGRADAQVKVRGHRVELGDVEASLARHPDVAGAAVRTWGEDSDRRLVGYVVPRAPGLDTAVVRADLRTRIPDYMVPSLILPIAELPCTANGKVDRNRLPEPPVPVGGDQYVAPRTSSERAIAEIWSQVLGVPKVGLHDDFFELGGHSLAAVQISARLKAMLGRTVPVQLLLRNSTIEELVAALGEQGAAAGQMPLAPRPPQVAAAPLSYVQRQLWVLDRLQPGRADYNEWVPWRLRGAVDLDAFTRAIDLIVDRHEVLRTRFESRGESPVQVVTHATRVTSLTDLSHLPPGAAESTARELLMEATRRPFDLETGPQIRVDLMRVAADDHIAVFVLHHVAGDRSSLSVLWRELNEAYTAFTAGWEPDLPPLPVQYADFAYWQQNGGLGDLSGQIDYWRIRLTDVSTCSLPEDHPRPAIWSGRGSDIGFVFPREVSALIRRYAQQSGATLFMVLLAGFQAVLARYSGQSDVVVGTPVTGRDRAELEPLIGCFLNTLVLRADLSPDPTFRDLTESARRDVVAALAHREVPFERLVEELCPDRDLSRNPLFQVLFGVDTKHVDPGLPGVDVELIESGTSRSKVDLALYVQDNPEQLTGTIEFATDLFEPESVEQFAGSYVRLLEAAIAEPDRRLSTLDLIPRGGRNRVLGQAHGRRDPAAERYLHDLVADRAVATPDRVAVCQGSVVLGYGDLERRSSRLARRLRRAGIGPERVVGVVMERSPELVIALLAVLKAGGAYVVADPSQPAAARRAFVLTDSTATVVLTQRRLTGILPAGLDAQIIIVDEDQAPEDQAPEDQAPTEGQATENPDAIELGDDAPPVRAASLDAIMAIYYTSGSTGKPKGVALTHRGVTNFLHYLTGTIGLRADDVILQLAAPTFDASIRDIFGPLIVGGRVVLPEPQAAGDPYALLSAIRDHQITALVTLVPSMISALARAAAGRAEDVWSLRLGLVSGEPLTRRHVDDLRLINPHMRLVNQYGPTECTMTTTYHAVGEDESGLISIGRPIPNAACHVLGGRGELLPNGSVGELYVATPGLARGYWNDPAGTAARFVPDPFGPPGGRLFRTGDRARRCHNGQLAFHGRLDDQLKIRGVRVEPGEVESAINACAGIAAAAVAPTGAPGATELVAYLVPGDGALDLESVRREIAAKLPGPLVPSRYVVLESLPLNAHGKVDRRKLPSPESGQVTTGLAPRDGLELRMAGIWARVLDRRSVGVADDFFAAGGHSLKAVELVDAINRELGVQVPMNMIFLNPTVERLCGALESVDIDSGSLVRKLAEGPSGKPSLFLVHPQSGDICSYLGVASALDEECSVYGIEAAGYSSGETPLESIPEMAARYVDEVQHIAAAGPYFLAGWSFGANVAVDMAARLEAAGHEVAFLGVIDARVFGTDPLNGLPSGRTALEKYALAAELTDGGSGGLENLSAMADEDALSYLLDRAKERGVVAPRIRSATMQRMVNMFAAHERAADRYQANLRVRADIHLFKASARHPYLPSPVVEPASWQEITAGAVHVIHTPGNHHDLLSESHVHSLAGHLGHALANIVERDRRSTHDAQ